MFNSVMPKVGLGLWKIAKQGCAQTVYDAIAALLPIANYIFQ